MPLSQDLVADFARKIADTAMGVCKSVTAPLYWAKDRDDGRRGTGNGSAFFVEIGKELIGITAAHVLTDNKSGWLAYCAQRGHTPLRLGGRKGSSVVLDWASRSLCVEPDLDIATFRVLEGELDAIDRKSLAVDAAAWPIGAPSVGHGVIYLGYAGAGTFYLPTDIVAFPWVSGIGSVSSLNERNISVRIERELLDPVQAATLLPQGFNYGGISGGPMLNVEMTSSARLRLTLAGVVIEGPPPSSEPVDGLTGLEVIVARRARFIQRDGRLDSDLWASLSPLRPAPQGQTTTRT